MVAAPGQKTLSVLRPLRRKRLSAAPVPSLENSTTHITSTGSLVFQDFEEGMTGVYTCFLEYKPTVEEVVKNLQLKFIVYGETTTRK